MKSLRKSFLIVMSVVCLSLVFILGNNSKECNVASASKVHFYRENLKFRGHWYHDWICRGKHIAPYAEGHHFKKTGGWLYDTWVFAQGHHHYFWQHNGGNDHKVTKRVYLKKVRRVLKHEKHQHFLKGKAKYLGKSGGWILEGKNWAA